MKYSTADLARLTGGRTSGKYVRIPGPDHSKVDDSLSIWPSDSNPDGFNLNSFAGDDPNVCREYVRNLIESGRLNTKRKRLKMLSARRNELPISKASAYARSQTRRVVANYIYKTADGTPYLRVQRTDPKGPFPQSHWKDGRWVSGKPAGPKIPYRLPDLIATPLDTPVFITEGEKDADNLATVGLIATTSSEGAGKWKPELNRWFAGRTVYILADNDEPGKKHAQQVARNLSGIAADVRIVNLPDLPLRGDVSDWLEKGNDAEQLVAFCTQSPRFGENAENFSAADLRLMEFTPVKYIVPGYIPEGVTVIAGKPKLGKSFAALGIGISVAEGGCTFGDIDCEQGDVFYLALEDNRRRLQARMEKLIGSSPWPERLAFRCKLPRLKDGGLQLIRQWVERAENPRLVIIDTFAKVRDGKGRDESSYEADYASVADLKALADEYGIAILLVHHVRKMGADDPLDTVSGTTGLTGAADTVLVLNRGSQGLTLYGRGRDIEEIHKAMEFNATTCRWRVLGDADEVHRSDERTRIIDALRESSDALSPREIADITGLSYESLRMMLSRMVRAGEIVREGRGRYRCSAANTRYNGCDDANGRCQIEVNERTANSENPSYNGYMRDKVTGAEGASKASKAAGNRVTDVTGRVMKPARNRRPRRHGEPVHVGITESVGQSTSISWFRNLHTSASWAVCIYVAFP